MPFSLFCTLPPLHDYLPQKGKQLLLGLLDQKFQKQRDCATDLPKMDLNLGNLSRARGLSRSARRRSNYRRLNKAS